MNNDIEDAIKNTINELEGTWALVIIYTKELDTYYVTRHGSPLLLGYNDNYIICTSETNGFIGLVNDYIPLKDNNIIKISNNNYNFLCESNNNLYNDSSHISTNDLNIKKVAYDDIVNSCKPYDHWLMKEIMEQPETIQKSYNYGARIHNDCIKLGGLDHIKNIILYIEHILLIGCGTSYNAGIIGEKYFKQNHNIVNITTLNACEFDINDIPNITNKGKILCIFLSQSGETIDVYNCLKICKNAGCITMGVINKVDSLIAREVDCGVYLNAGPEISVASTKSFTSMIIVLSLIEMWFSQNLTRNFMNNSDKINSLRFLSNTITNLLNSFTFLNKINQLSSLVVERNINNIFILGKNKLFPVACEGSLKIKEVTYIHSEGFSAGSLKHGPFALLDNTNLTLLLIDETDIANYQNLKSTYYEIVGRETNIYVITNSTKVIEELKLKGKGSQLVSKDVKMFSDGFIEVNNISGNFFINGLNSKLVNDEIIIQAKQIDGVFLDNGNKKNINSLNVYDEKISYVKNIDTEMYAKKINFNYENSIIELIDDVTIIRNEEKISGDYGTLDTTNNSYKIKSKNKNKVKVVIQNNE